MYLIVFVGLKLTLLVRFRISLQWNTTTIYGIERLIGLWKLQVIRSSAQSLIYARNYAYKTFSQGSIYNNFKRKKYSENEENWNSFIKNYDFIAIVFHNEAQKLTKLSTLYYDLLLRNKYKAKWKKSIPANLYVNNGKGLKPE